MQVVNPEIARAILVLQAEGTFVNGPLSGQRGYTIGTAFWVPQGILTAYHTLQRVGKDCRVTVYNPEMGECRAELIAKDEDMDLALLRPVTQRLQFRFFTHPPASSSSHLQLMKEDFIEEDTPIVAIVYSPGDKPRAMSGRFAENVDLRVDGLFGFLGNPPSTPDPNSLRASFRHMFCPQGFSGGPILKTDGSLLSVVSTWHPFLCEVRGATLAQLRAFLLSGS